jgi:hypothetical protein
MSITRTTQYKWWKQSLYKWDSWIQNRHQKIKQCDAWSRFIVEDCVGSSAVFNSGGMFFKDFMPDITVIEVILCPIKVNGMIYLEKYNNFDQKFDNLIMINPISLKYNHSVLDFLVTPGLSRAGYKPAILNWIKRPGKIYLSFSDWHIYYDRLKFTVHDMLAAQIKELQQNGIRCEYSEVSNVNSDVENGNIKLVLSIENVYNSTN